MMPGLSPAHVFNNDDIPSYFKGLSVAAVASADAGSVDQRCRQTAHRLRSFMKGSQAYLHLNIEGMG